MNSFLKWVGIVFIGVIIFIAGFAFGVSGANQENIVANQSKEQIRQQAEADKKQQEQAKTAAVADIMQVSANYSALYSLCEQKYQTAIKGDYSTATRLNGQMDVLLKEIDTTLGKYDQKSDIKLQ